MPRVAADPTKKQPITESQLLTAIAHGEVDELLRRRKLSFSVATKAVETARKFNPKIKLPDSLQAEMARLESQGTRRGVKSPPQVGETRKFKIINYNATKKIAVSPSCVVNLSCFPESSQEGAYLQLTWHKGGKITGQVIVDRSRIDADDVDDEEDEEDDESAAGLIQADAE